MLAVAGVVDDSIYLFSGTDLVLDQDAKITRKYLTDGFKFDLNKKSLDADYLATSTCGSSTNSGNNIQP